ncbi:MAG: trypsin-like peptidase domain-containing protein, partial [Gammaproteobacteria bacterium]
MKAHRLLPWVGLFFVASAHAYYPPYGPQWDEEQLRFYQEETCAFKDFVCALAVSADGAWGSASTTDGEAATKDALERCRFISTEPQECILIDVNAESDFVSAGESADSGSLTNDEPQPTGTGTGFFVHPNFAVTSGHVLQTCRQVSFRYRQHEYDAEIYDIDATHDLGLLRVSDAFPAVAALR